MTSILTLRLLQQNCGRTVFSTISNQGRNGIFQRIPMQSLASLSYLQKYNKNLPLDIQKSTVNKCVIRTSSTDHAKGHDHVKLWTAEKVMTATLLGAAFPSAVLFNNPATEFFLALCLTVHAHWGLEAIVVDYVRPSMFGNAIPKLSVAFVYALSALSLGGLGYFIYTDVGLVNAVKLLWKL